MRVLIADGDEPSLEILQSFLWRQGFEVEIATNSLECLAILRDFRPVVLVLEADLPWGGSDVVLTEMEATPALCDIPLILVADSQEEFNAATNWRAADWLQKPFRLGDLVRRIRFAARKAESAHSLMEVK